MRQALPVAMCFLLVGCKGEVVERASCEDVSCGGHGQCRVRSESPYCVCQAGFHPVGLSCVLNDAHDPCVEVSCNRRGTCIVGEAGEDLPRCECDQGYERDESGMLCFRGMASITDGGVDAALDADIRPDVEIEPDAEGLDGDVADTDVEDGEDDGPFLVAGGGEHSCALAVNTGTMRCWGRGLFGQLGTGHRGDVELASASDVDVGGRVIEIALGAFHTCALIDGGTVRCWGSGEHGRLGLGDTETIGDNEVPSSAPIVDVGGVVSHISAGFSHSCALLQRGTVRCWGNGAYGQLGYGNVENIGDDEEPLEAGDVSLDGLATAISAGAGHTCALLNGGSVRCWGSGEHGRLGMGDTEDIGDNELPSDIEEVEVGGIASHIAAWGNHTCVVIVGGSVRCFGHGAYGQLGAENTTDIGDDEVPATVAPIDVGAPVITLTTGWWHSCAQMLGGGVRCWGQNLYGQLGYDHHDNIGDDEAPSSAGDIPLDGLVTDLAAGGTHTCVVLDGNDIRCFGGSP